MIPNACLVGHAPLASSKQEAVMDSSIPSVPLVPPAMLLPNTGVGAAVSPIANAMLAHLAMVP